MSAGIEADAIGWSSQLGLPPSVNSSTGYGEPAAGGSPTRMTAVRIGLCLGRHRVSDDPLHRPHPHAARRDRGYAPARQTGSPCDTSATLAFPSTPAHTGGAVTRGSQRGCEMTETIGASVTTCPVC